MRADHVSAEIGKAVTFIIFLYPEHAYINFKNVICAHVVCTRSGVFCPYKYLMNHFRDGEFRVV